MDAKALAIPLFASWPDPGSRSSPSAGDSDTRCHAGKDSPGTRGLRAWGTGPSITSVAATSAELRAALSAAAMPSTEPKDFLPNGFGCNEASDHYASWCGKYILRGEYCDAEGCTIEDQITTKITVDPGAESSRVVYKSLYVPDHFDFTQIHFEWWTLCFHSAEVCGTGNTPSFAGNSSGPFFPTSSVILYGDRLAHAFDLWAFFEPTGQWYASPPGPDGYRHLRRGARPGLCLLTPISCCRTIMTCFR
jgi:hypothetical protein